MGELELFIKMIIGLVAAGVALGLVLGTASAFVRICWRASPYIVLGGAILYIVNWIIW
jgi:hypothetical protein